MTGKDVRRVPEVERRRKFRFPTAFTVLAGVLLLVWFASFVVPAGHYQLDKDGAPVPGTYESCRLFGAGGNGVVLDVASPAESGVAPADAASAPGATVSDLGVPCVDDSLSFRFKQLWNSPANGLYGVESGKGFVGPWEEGFLYGSAAIFLFVLAVGAFITVTMKTGRSRPGSAGWHCGSGAVARSSLAC